MYNKRTMAGADTCDRFCGPDDPNNPNVTEISCVCTEKEGWLHSASKMLLLRDKVDVLDTKDWVPGWSLQRIDQKYEYTQTRPTVRLYGLTINYVSIRVEEVRDLISAFAEHVL